MPCVPLSRALSGIVSAHVPGADELVADGLGVADGVAPRERDAVADAVAVALPDPLAVDEELADPLAELEGEGEDDEEAVAVADWVAVLETDAVCDRVGDGVAANDSDADPDDDPEDELVAVEDAVAVTLGVLVGVSCTARVVLQ